MFPDLDRPRAVQPRYPLVVYGRPALREFARIATEWELGDAERHATLGCSAATYAEWNEAVAAERQVELPYDVLLRISAVLGIRSALTVLHEDQRERVDWLRRPHASSTFGGEAPMANLISGDTERLVATRRFLDATCAGNCPIGPNEADVTSPTTGDDIVFLND